MLRRIILVLAIVSLMATMMTVAAAVASAQADNGAIVTHGACTARGVPGEGNFVFTPSGNANAHCNIHPEENPPVGGEGATVLQTPCRVQPFPGAPTLPGSGVIVETPSGNTNFHCNAHP